MGRSLGAAALHTGEGSAQATRLLAKEYMRFVRLQSRGENEGVEVSMPDTLTPTPALTRTRTRTRTLALP